VRSGSLVSMMQSTRELQHEERGIVVTTVTSCKPLHVCGRHTALKAMSSWHSSA
jgi:hypothetical protein